MELVPGPQQILKSADAQVPQIKWCTEVGPASAGVEPSDKEDHSAVSQLLKKSY